MPDTLARACSALCLVRFRCASPWPAGQRQTGHAAADFAGQGAVSL